MKENRFEPSKDREWHATRGSQTSGNMVNKSSRIHYREETAEDEAQWIVHECPVCHPILRARTVPAGVHEGVLHERVETQYLRIHGSERFWLSGGLL